jgi:23S rRNA (uracil-5-)-methyltransferase RumA
MTLTAKALRRQIIDTVRADEPVAPRCPHAPPAGFCGGCTFQDRAYATQVAAKGAALRELWASDLANEIRERVTMIASPEPYAYRTRMDYVASRARFGLRRGGKFNFIVDLSECHLIPPPAFAVARLVYERAVALGLPDYNLRSHEGFLRYVIVRLSPQGELLIAVTTASRDYAAELDQVAALALAQPQVAGFHWLLNETVTDLSFGTPVRHWGAATLPMRVGRYRLAIGPNTFFQNNIHLLLPLLDDVASYATGAARVADLYSGVGMIALHLSDHVEQVVCVESAAESADLATQNVAANTIGNVAVVAAEVLPFLREQPAGRFDLMVADPPRIGLGPDVCRELLRLGPRRLIYVSCNPLTQLDDARILAAGYRIAELHGYDMFPQTPHMEALAVFERHAAPDATQHGSRA